MNFCFGHIFRILSAIFLSRSGGKLFKPNEQILASPPPTHTHSPTHTHIHAHTHIHPHTYIHTRALTHRRTHNHPHTYPPQSGAHAALVKSQELRSLQQLSRPEGTQVCAAVNSKSRSAVYVFINRVHMLHMVHGRIERENLVVSAT